MVPIGLDHRCVHCIMSFKKRAATHKQMKRYGMKNWKPIMDDQGRPSDFQHAISATMSTRTLSGFNDLEDVLLAAGRLGGACMKQKQRFRESTILQSLRSDRRMAQSVEERKRLTFMIQTKHKQELQTWKTSKINEVLSRKSSWKLFFFFSPRLFDRRTFSSKDSPHAKSNPPKSGRTSSGERVCIHVGTTICWRSRR